MICEMRGEARGGELGDDDSSQEVRHRHLPHISALLAHHSESSDEAVQLERELTFWDASASGTHFSG